MHVAAIVGIALSGDRRGDGAGDIERRCVGASCDRTFDGGTFMRDQDCAWASEAMLLAADETLPAAECAWLDAHLDGCSECRASRSRLVAIDDELTKWARTL